MRAEAARTQSPPSGGFDFEIMRLRFELLAVDPIVLPGDNKGNALRGAFGTVFKSLCCGPVCRKCSECALHMGCAYAAIFEPSPPPGSERLSGNQDIPRPFVFRPPGDSKSRYAAGEKLSFDLLLFGAAVQYLAYFVVAFRELVERGFGIGRGRCRLHTIAAQERTGAYWSSVYSDTDQCVRPPASHLSASDLLSAAGGGVNEITIEFLTPTELKHEGRVVRVPEFHHLIKRLRDRTNAIGWFYSGAALDLDFAEFGRRAEAVQCVSEETVWVDRERYSTRTHRRHPIGGFAGRVRYEGELSEFLPFLRLGEWIHVGKHAVWGNGQYRIISPELG